MSDQPGVPACLGIRGPASTALQSHFEIALPVCIEAVSQRWAKTVVWVVNRSPDVCCRSSPMMWGKEGPWAVHKPLMGGCEGAKHDEGGAVSILHFEPSLDAPNLRSDVISSKNILSFGRRS